MLRRSGERVDMLVMLDTPYPEDNPIDVTDKITIKLQDMRRDKGAFLIEWMRRRAAWAKMQRLRKSRAQQGHTSEEFHNEQIEAAFRRALGRYRADAYDGQVLLLRPKLEIAYRLRDGRFLHADRNLLRSDNGWTPYVSKFTIKEVPGDHDSMVLEPNVRMLAKYMREAMR
jgi:thioesterase domain-containing protein